MKNLIMPITAILLCLAAMAVMYFIQHKKKNKSAEPKNIASESAQDFVNIREIRDIFLYTKDDYLLTYVKVQPISFDLLTEEEQKQLARRITDEFSQMRLPFKFLAVSRPIDIGPIVNTYYELMSDSNDQVQKELLRNAMKIVSNFSLSGEVVQREFYYMLWERKAEDTEKELKKATGEFLEHMESAGLKGEILKANEIIKLCNLVNNPAFASIEDTSVEATIPYLIKYLTTRGQGE
ncbi:hypothetical protein [Anaeromicropila populeti]|uniref:Uncharacterized protein n=1 Tax=Anaeromicropila populeti TaxID=37658 RepID=A0A1I6JG80_9FIRM|nr:hypothetical protein [Anaeromicropila populeti]SFR77869.1 hypothetical protein SAMN05661086_01651 [Anaeromicropila populeti]